MNDLRLADVTWSPANPDNNYVNVRTKMPDVTFSPLPISDELRHRLALQDKARDLIEAMTDDELSLFISSRKPRDENQYDPHDCIAAVVAKYNQDFASEDRRP